MGENEERLNVPEAGGKVDLVPRGRGFQPGHKKYGGRKPGAPIKRTAQARELAEKLGFHPVEFFIHCVRKGELPNEDGTTTKLDASQRLDAAKTVTQYLIPKLAQTAVTGADEGPVAVALPTQQILSDPAMASKLSELALMVAEQAPEEPVN